MSSLTTRINSCRRARLYTILNKPKEQERSRARRMITAYQRSIPPEVLLRELGLIGGD